MARSEQKSPVRPAGRYTGDSAERQCFLHVYRGETALKVVTVPDREFHGHKDRQLHTYEVRGNGDLVPVTDWLEQARSAS